MSEEPRMSAGDRVAGPGRVPWDWHAWHDGYDQPGSRLARRLADVQARVSLALDAAPPGPLRAVSMVAGQGRDLIGVLARHPRGRDVTARLVEADPRNATVAAGAAAGHGLAQVEVLVGDAASLDNYAGAVPADLVLVCGLFGNITPADIHRTIAHCARLCRNGATLIWTRHRNPPDLVPRICDWFAEHDFELRWLTGIEQGYGVGVHRFAGSPGPLTPGPHLFTFVGHEALPPALADHSGG